MNTLTAIQRDTLVVLNGIEPASGVDVRNALGEYYQEEITGGRFYPSIDELVEVGLVQKGSDDGRTNQYSLTEEGNRRLSYRERWIEQQLDGSL